MALSMQDYVVRLRAIYRQGEAVSNLDGHVPPVSEQEWTEVLHYAFQKVPELEPHWREIGVWVAHMMTLLDAYHVLAGHFLEEEETVKLPTSHAQEGRRRLLDYQEDGEDGG